MLHNQNIARQWCLCGLRTKKRMTEAIVVFCKMLAIFVQKHEYGENLFRSSFIAQHVIKQTMN